MTCTGNVSRRWVAMVLLERAQHVWTASVSGPPVPPGDDGEPSVREVGRVWQIALALLPVFVLAAFWRLWQQAFAFSNGLDATMPNFARYWMTLFFFNIGVIPMVAAAAYAWLIVSGAKAARVPLTPAEETRRIWRLWLIVAALPVSFALVVGGSILLMFQVAFNEFGHTFWQTEEVFSAPLHWPFVIFAYLLFATFAIWFSSAVRLAQLVRQEEGK